MLSNILGAFWEYFPRVHKQVYSALSVPLLGYLGPVPRALQHPARGTLPFGGLLYPYTGLPPIMPTLAWKGQDPEAKIIITMVITTESPISQWLPHPTPLSSL